MSEPIMLTRIISPIGTIHRHVVAAIDEGAGEPRPPELGEEHQQAAQHDDAERPPKEDLADVSRPTVALPLGDEAAAVLLPVDAPFPAQTARFSVEGPQILVQELHVVTACSLLTGTSDGFVVLIGADRQRAWRRPSSRGRPPLRPSA